MSVQNGERFIRLLNEDSALRKRVRQGGEAAFLELSAEAQASCTPYEVVSAMIKQIDPDA